MRLGSVVFYVSFLCMVSFPGTGNEGTKIPKIGLVWASNASVVKPYEDAFREGLRSLGYIDGTNVIVVSRHAQGNPQRFHTLIEELIAADVDILVPSITAIPAAMKGTRTIPIVAPSMGSDPVGDGLVARIARPGGNVTGGYAGGLDAKRYQFAVEAMPRLKRVGLLFEATSPNYLKWASRSRARAESLGLSVQTYPVQNLDDIRAAFSRIGKDQIQALMIWAMPLMLMHRETIMQLASRKLVVIGEGQEFAEAGALITYSQDIESMWRTAAVQVDKILKGANVSTLPVEQPTKFVLRLNRKTARDRGITMPQSLLLQADQVIQ